MTKVKRHPSHRAPYVQSSRKILYQGLIDKLERNYLDGGDQAKSHPIEFMSLVLMNDPQVSKILWKLKNQNISEEVILGFLKFFVCEVVQHRGLMCTVSRIPFKSDPYADEMELALRNLVRLFRDPRATKYLSKNFLARDSEPLLRANITVETQLSLLCELLEPQFKKQDLRIAALKQRPRTKLELLKKSSNQEWLAYAVLTATECQKLFDSRMPGLVAALFNTSLVRDVFPNLPTITRGQITKINLRMAKKGVLSDLKPKPNPAIKPRRGGQVP